MLVLGLILTCLVVCESFSHGQRAGNKCMFQNPDVSFVWDELNRTTSSKTQQLYTIEDLNEEKYIRKTSAPTQLYELPQPFVDYRYKAEEGLLPYKNFPDFKPNYEKLFKQLPLKHAFLDELLNISITRQPRKIAIFSNVWTNNYGLIVEPSTCAYLRNGGCTYMKHNRIYALNGQPSENDVVVSLTAGAFGTWHFPMEIFVGIAALPEKYLTSAQFHVPSKSSFITSWLHAVGIKDEHIIDTPWINAKTLLVPQQGRCCEMYETQIEWLRQKVGHLPEHHVSYERQIILITRSGSRQVENAHAVDSWVKQFAVENKYEIVLHEDRHLPSLELQIARFAKAPIVIAPHGAGLLFTAFSPSNACIVEFMPMINPECYARIAYIRRLKYTMYMMDGRKIRLNEVADGLRRCVALFESNSTNVNGPSSSTSKSSARW